MEKRWPGKYRIESMRSFIAEMRREIARDDIEWTTCVLLLANRLEQALDEQAE